MCLNDTGHCYISMDENKKSGPGGVTDSVYTENLHICTTEIGAANLSRFYNLRQVFFQLQRLFGSYVQ